MPCRAQSARPIQIDARESSLWIVQRLWDDVAPHDEPSSNAPLGVMLVKAQAQPAAWACSELMLVLENALDT